MRVTVAVRRPAPIRTRVPDQEAPLMRRSVTAGFAAVLVAGLLPLLAPATADAAPGSAAAPSATADRAGPKYKILVLMPAGASKAEKTGVQQLRQLGLDRGFTLEATDDTSVVTT